MEHAKPIIPVYVDYEQLQQSMGIIPPQNLVQRSHYGLDKYSTSTGRKKPKYAGGFQAYNMPGG